MKNHILNTIEEFFKNLSGTDSALSETTWLVAATYLAGGIMCQFSNIWVRFACLLVLAFGSCSQAYAVADSDNHGQWNKPTVNNLPDKEVPGFFVNLGPTGARAILTEKTFIIKYIFSNSPAIGRLIMNDEIVGVFGKPFTAHHFKGGRGYEGPIMDFGEGIEKAESTDGKLVINVKRGSSIEDVTIDLEPIGAFSATFPINCTKSEILRRKALQYFADHPDSWKVGQSHARSTVALALLTSDDPKQKAIGKDMCLRWNDQRPNAGTWTWNLAYQIITLAEYHLMTKDTSVLPTIAFVSDLLAKAQYQGKILVWGPTGDEALSKVPYEKVDAAQQLYDGGFGHAPYRAGAREPNTGNGWGPNGYGPMQYPTIFAVIAWQLAERCGVAVDPERIKCALEFIHRGTNAAGYVAYGGEFTLNAGLNDPAKFVASTRGENYVGRSGAALIAHKLSPEFAESNGYIDKYRSYLKHAYKSMPDGHADANLGIVWSFLGVGASEDDSALRTLLDYHKYYINMARCHDGSFVLQPGRDYADSGYYMSSRYHPTGSMILMFGLSNPKLLIQGIQVSVPGINPKALEGKLDLAYRAIVAKEYAAALHAINSVESSKVVSVSDAVACQALTKHISEQMELELEKLLAMKKMGDYYHLDMALDAMKKVYSNLKGFEDKIVNYEDGFKETTWKDEVKLGARYVKMIATLTRSRSKTSMRDLERFAERYPESLYGKWAAIVAREFKENGVIIDPLTVTANVEDTKAVR